MNADDKSKLVTALRRLVECATVALSEIAIDNEDAATRMTSVSSMYVGECVALITGNERAGIDIHMTAHNALQKQLDRVLS